MISNGGLIPRRHALSRYLGILGGTVITAAAVALAGGMPVRAAAATAPAAGSGGWSGPRVLQGPRGITERGIFFSALSCTSRSDCTAVGSDLGRSPGRALEIVDFAVTERRGVWGRALIIAAPAAARNVPFGAPVLSCASAGNCAAGDSYIAYPAGSRGGFVVSETNGTWGKARQVRSVPSAMSCPAPGDCTAALAGGYLLSEKHGTWRTPFLVPGLAALNHDTSADTVLISCPSPGNCAAAGTYLDPSGDRSFVVTQRHGIWGKAQPVRTGPETGLVITALSCPSAGSCVAAGDASTGRGDGSFAVAEAHGRWGTATFLPGTFRLREGVSLLDCPAPGACVAVGEGSPRQDSLTFVSTEKNGTWNSAQTIPGLFPPNIDSLSCDAAGSCVLAGAGGGQAAAAVLVNGRWGPARILRGVRAVARGRASEIEAVSCPARSRCTAVGTFLVPHFAGPLFAVVQR